jgi:hypothetical protein
VCASVAMVCTSDVTFAALIVGAVDDADLRLQLGQKALAPIGDGRGIVGIRQLFSSRGGIDLGQLQNNYRIIMAFSAVFPLPNSKTHIFHAL